MAELIETVQTMIDAALAEAKFLGKVTAISGTTVQVKRPTQIGPDAQFYASVDGLVAGTVLQTASLAHAATAIPAHTATGISAHAATPDAHISDSGGDTATVPAHTVAAHSAVTVPPHGSITVPAHATVTLRAPLKVGDTVTVERYGANYVVTGKVAG